MFSRPPFKLNIATGTNGHEVRVALDDEALGRVYQDPWHRTQKLEPLPDGRTQLTLRLKNFTGITNLVIGEGSHAEVLAPAELRTKVGATIKQILELYK